MANSTNRSFTLFSALPLELRLQIWRASCTPRVVTVSWDPDTNKYRLHHTVSPPILLVNRESRLEALAKVYTSFFTPQRVYFSPHLDTLYVARDAYMGYSAPEREIGHYLRFAPDCVRSLAVDHVVGSERREWETYSKWCLIRSFPQLEEAYLVVGGFWRDRYLSTGKPREANDQEKGQTIELVHPLIIHREVAARELDDFVETWIYELANSSDQGGDFKLSDEVKGNKYLSTILHARRGDQWKGLWKCREARVAVYGEESEWWSVRRKSDLAWVDVPDGVVYRTKSGVRYYRKVRQGAELTEGMGGLQL